MFLSANQAREQGRDNSVITQEIAIISLRIVDAIAANQLATMVSAETTVVVNGVTVTGSIMTNANELGQDYYRVWQGAVTDTVKLTQMSKVIEYFAARRYNIVRISTTGTEFYWSISW
jgi:S-adenosylmethionine synthetase